MSNKLTKPELFELVLKTQVNSTNRIDSLVEEIREDLKQCYKRVELYVAVARNVNSKFVEQIADLKREC